MVVSILASVERISIAEARIEVMGKDLTPHHRSNTLFPLYEKHLKVNGYIGDDEKFS